MELIGFIQNTVSKSGTGRNGKPWTKYDGEIRAENGTVTKVSFGFQRPQVREGDFVYLVANDQNGFLTVDQSTIQRRDPPKPQSEPVKEVAEVRASLSNSDFPKAEPQEYNRKTNPEDAKRITYANARDAAIAMVDVLMKHKALPSSTAESKTGQTKRFDEMTAAVDKFTVQFFHDSMTLRRLDVVADTPPTNNELPEHQKLPDDAQIDKAQELDN